MYSYADIPKKLDNEHSKLWASIIAAQRGIEMLHANRQRAIRKLGLEI